MPKLIVKQIPVGSMMNFAYLIGCDLRGDCAAVDPGWDAGKISAAADESGWKISKILLTHTHFDHAQSLAELSSLTGAQVYVHEMESRELPQGLQIKTTTEGTKIPVGDSFVTCLHTPGHTPGSQCFLTDSALITGDTLFIDACGRVDLPGSDPRAMLSSLARLARLLPGIVVYPGHDYGPKPTATIGEQRKTNPFLSAESEAMLI